jgi:membrane fusion protein (multidrug efflux system)
MTDAKPATPWRAPPDWTWRAVIFLLAVAILVLITTRWNRWETNSRWQTTDDAYLQSDLTPIAAKVSGYVRSMPVEDFERVRAGQLIAEIVDDDYKATVDQLSASVAAASAQIAALKAQQALQSASVEAARASVAAIAANVQQNARDLARQEVLFKTGSSSTEAAEKPQTIKAQLAAQLLQSRAQANAAERQLTVLSAQQAQAEAALQAQQANLEIARINLRYTRVVAPAQVRVDTFPGHALRAHVLAFAPAAGSQFALLPPDNATGNFTKVVQRVAVKIAIDDADGLIDRLRPGMSVVARVDTRGGERR